MKRRLFFTSLYLAVTVAGIAQSAATFKQWGDELYALMYRDLKNTSFTYLYRENTTTNRSAAYAWPMGVQLKALIYADKLTEAEGLANEFHSNYISTTRGYSAYNAVRGGSNDRYYDDNAWLVKDLMDLYTKTNKIEYVNRAKIIMQFCMSGERLGRTFNIQVKDKVTGLYKDTTVIEGLGGIRFHENNSNLTTSDGYFNKTFNTFSWCATAPVTVANLKIYRATNEQKYLTDGTRLYENMKTYVWGIGPGYRGYENAVVMQAALHMYEITGEQKYLLDAQQLGYSMEAVYISWQSQRLNEYGCWGGHDMTDAYVHMYNVDKNPYWLGVVAGYLSYLRNNCRDAQGYYPEQWNDTSKSTTKVIGLLDQASALAAFYKMASTPGAEPKTHQPVAIFKECDYNRTRESGNFNIGLNVGAYTKNDLTFLGHTNNRFVFNQQISSVKVSPGYMITLFRLDNFRGDSIVYTKDTPFLGNWHDIAVSVKVALCPDPSIYEDVEYDLGATAIATFDQLNAIRNSRVLDPTDNKYKITGKYYLISDIEIPDGVEWIPIGATSVSDTDPAAFVGKFDGRGYSIKNLTIGKSGYYTFKGLFSRLKGATVKNLNLENVDIKGSSPVGGVAGAFYGGTTIERVSVTGSILASGVHVGGISGRSSQDFSSNYNFVNNCYVNATVKTLDSHAGGIIGQLQSASGGLYSKLRIQDVYVKGRVEAKTNAASANAAGIIALVQGNVFDMVRAVVACDEIIGGTPNFYFSRDQYPNFFVDNYVRNDLSLNYYNSSDKGRGAESKYQTVKSVYAQFLTRNFYENILGWDFQKVWKITEGEFPTFQSMAPTSVKNTEAADKYCNIIGMKGMVKVMPYSKLQINVLNLSGQSIYKGTIDSETNLTLQTGVYIVHAASRDMNYSKKVVVK
jgi:hypothetical protein